MYHCSVIKVLRGFGSLFPSFAATFDRISRCSCFVKNFFLLFLKSFVIFLSGAAASCGVRSILAYSHRQCKHFFYFFHRLSVTILVFTPFVVKKAFSNKIVLRTMARLSVQKTVHALASSRNVHALASSRNVQWTFLSEWTYLSEWTVFK